MKKKEFELILQRTYCGKEYTIGNLSLDGHYICDTLEPKWRDYAKGEEKVPGKSAIPAGTYRLGSKWNAKLRSKVITVLNVPKFEGIQIHAGNYPADTKGCILVGFNNIPGMVCNSKSTLDYILRRMGWYYDGSIPAHLIVRDV